MNIFIDESGNFQPQKKLEGDFSPDCVSAVVFTDEAHDKWVERYGSLKKGRVFYKSTAKKIFEFLNEIGAKVFLVVVDCNSYSESDIKKHQENYIFSIHTGTSDHPEWLRAGILKHVKYLKEMSPQQYVKTMLIVRLIENVCRGIFAQTSFFSKEDFFPNKVRCHKVDEKTRSTIKYFVNFAIFASSKKDPVQCDDLSKIPGFLNTHPSEPGKQYLNIAKFLEDLDFKSDGSCDGKSSDGCVGIKAADCVANFTRRMLSNEKMRKNRLDFSDRSYLVDLLGFSCSVEFLHFDMDKPFIDIEIKDKYAVSVLRDLQ